MSNKLIYLIALCLVWMGQNLWSQSADGFNLNRLNRMRPVSPFDSLINYRLTDTLIRKQQQDTTQTISPWMQTLGNIVLGPEVFINKQASLLFDGLAYVFNNSNRIDGAWLGYEVVGTWPLQPGKRLIVRIANNYTTRLGKWMNETHLLYYYAPQRSAVVVLSGGVTSRETIHQTYEELFETQWLAPIGTNTPIRGFRKPFVSIRNSIDLFPGLRGTALLAFEYRQPQIEKAAYYTHRALVTEVNLQWDFARRRPSNRSYEEGLQLPIGAFAPSIGITYRAALSPQNNLSSIPYSHYQLIEWNLRTAITLKPSRKVYGSVTAGRFIERKHVSIADERYLTEGSAIGRIPFTGSWSTLPEAFTLGKHWFWTSIDADIGQITFGKIFPRYLDERIHIRGALTDQGQWYEAGYSVGTGEWIRLGLFGGGNLKDNYGFTARLTIPLFLLLGRASSRY